MSDEERCARWSTGKTIADFVAPETSAPDAVRGAILLLGGIGVAIPLLVTKPSAWRHQTS
jgi:hypothetical protein